MELVRGEPPAGRVGAQGGGQARVMGQEVEEAPVPVCDLADDAGALVPPRLGVVLRAPEQVDRDDVAPVPVARSVRQLVAAHEVEERRDLFRRRHVS